MNNEPMNEEPAEFAKVDLSTAKEALDYAKKVAGDALTDVLAIRAIMSRVTLDSADRDVLNGECMDKLLIAISEIDKISIKPRQRVAKKPKKA